MYGSVLSATAGGIVSRLSEVREQVSTGSLTSSEGFSEASAPSFGEVLTQVTDTLGQKLQAAEVQSLQGLKGEATINEVVSSVMEAEQSLHAAIAIRDKIVQAYLEISRMSI